MSALSMEKIPPLHPQPRTHLKFYVPAPPTALETTLLPLVTNSQLVLASCSPKPCSPGLSSALVGLYFPPGDVPLLASVVLSPALLLCFGGSLFFLCLLSHADVSHVLSSGCSLSFFIPLHLPPHRLFLLACLFM